MPRQSKPEKVVYVAIEIFAGIMTLIVFALVIYSCGGLMLNMP